MQYSSNQQTVQQLRQAWLVILRECPKITRAPDVLLACHKNEYMLTLEDHESVKYFQGRPKDAEKDNSVYYRVAQRACIRTEIEPDVWVYVIPDTDHFSIQPASCPNLVSDITDAANTYLVPIYWSSNNRSRTHRGKLSNSVFEAPRTSTQYTSPRPAATATTTGPVYGNYNVSQTGVGYNIVTPPATPTTNTNQLGPALTGAVYSNSNIQPTSYNYSWSMS